MWKPKASFRHKALDALYRAERAMDRVTYSTKQRFGWVDPVRILPYRGYGNQRGLHLRGRVLEDKPVGSPKAQDPWWRNVANMCRRLATDEIPGAKVRARYGDLTEETETDEEGYFFFELEPGRLVAEDEPWQTVRLELAEPVVPEQKTAVAEGKVLTPTSAANFGVISDVDDTIIHSRATNLWKMARITFLNNARTRMPLPGVAHFYRALARGPEGEGQNAFFYVSSTIWNLYDLFIDFMDLHGLPAGPILLRDAGIDRNKFITSGHGHKLVKIRHILDTYPELPFILIGDAGQDDPLLYRQIVADFPDRIQAVYIRDVPSSRRFSDIQSIIEDVRDHGSEMIFVRNTRIAALHAAERGWIATDSLDDIDRDVDRDARRPALIETFL